MRALTAVMIACTLGAGCQRNHAVEEQARIVVRDDAGRTVALPDAAQRVVSLMPTVTDLLVALGAADRLIARTDYDSDPGIAHLPSVGGGLTPSIEWLAAQQPDLVIAWPDNPARSLVGRIATAGIPVYAARTEVIESTLRTIRNLGVLLAVSPAADSLAYAITSGLDSVRTSMAGRAPVSVAYVMSVQPPTVAGPGNFIDELIETAGGSNVFSDVTRPWPEISLEELVQRDPDVVVLARETGGDPQTQLQRLPGWRDLRAVRTGNVHRVSPDLFNRSGPHMPRAARELAHFFSQAQ